MIQDAALSVLYPLKPQTLPIRIIETDGFITTVEAIVDEIPFCFTRNEEGFFKSKSVPKTDAAYIAYIERQLSRMFN